MYSLYRNKYSNLILAKVTMGRGLGSSEESGRGESIWVVIYICMETIQGISLYSYLYLKLAKTPCFSYYLFWFFSYKIGEQKGRQVLPGGGGGSPNNVYTCK
jgi:hypothetical protein